MSREIKIFKVVYGYNYCKYCDTDIDSKLAQEVTDWEEITDDDYYDLINALGPANNYNKDQYIIVQKGYDREEFSIKETVKKFKEKIEKQKKQAEKKKKEYEKKKEENKKKRELKKLEELKNKYEELKKKHEG